MYKKREASRFYLFTQGHRAGKSLSRIRKEAEESSVHGLPRPPETPEKSERKTKSLLSENKQLFSFTFHLEFIKLKFILKFHKS